MLFEDKRAVERGQVVFHDIAFIEAAPRYDAKDKASLQVELTDSSVYYTLGAMDAVIASLREGKSQVVCDGGQLVKVNKSKAGVVSRETLTKVWTDWVDYWAVDFDYGSRKEIVKRPKSLALQGSLVEPSQGELVEWEDWWTGGYVFENEWQSFRTRQDRKLELKSAPHAYAQPGRYKVAVKVIDIFGNDTMTLLPVSVGGDAWSPAMPSGSGELRRSALPTGPVAFDASQRHGVARKAVLGCPMW